MEDNIRQRVACLNQNLNPEELEKWITPLSVPTTPVPGSRENASDTGPFSALELTTIPEDETVDTTDHINPVIIVP